MYDVAIMRDLAMGAHLPSDDLGADFSYVEVTAAISVAMAAEELGRAVALCVAGRIRFPSDQALFRTEATALTAMGFSKQAGYRLRMADALEDAIVASRPQEGPHGAKSTGWRSDLFDPDQVRGDHRQLNPAAGR